MGDAPLIEVRDLTIRFRMNYERTYSLQSKVAQKLRHWYRRTEPKSFTAVDGISLAVRKGEIVGIIGRNGCGKTTLLRSICGIYAPDGGTVACRGKVSNLLSLGAGFNNKLNGIDNIRYNGLVHGMTAAEIDEKLPEILAFADIGEHVHMPMKYYSSGMISRLGFAIILAVQPDILLIDEIFSVGDLAFKKKSERAIHELLAKASCQLIVSHDLKMVKQHCTRAIYMRRGQIWMDGKPAEVVARYVRDMAAVGHNVAGNDPTELVAEPVLA
jgi:ABC-type polysaccharide/polyol phosphate transport system ATPase subunit